MRVDLHLAVPGFPRCAEVDSCREFPLKPGKHRRWREGLFSPAMAPTRGSISQNSSSWKFCNAKGISQQLSTWRARRAVFANLFQADFLFANQNEVVSPNGCYLWCSVPRQFLAVWSRQPDAPYELQPDNR
jgi:hypothetical protein